MVLAAATPGHIVLRPIYAEKAPRLRPGPRSGGACAERGGAGSFFDMPPAVTFTRCHRRQPKGTPRSRKAMSLQMQRRSSCLLTRRGDVAQPAAAAAESANLRICELRGCGGVGV